jgi:hypothetical protein
MLFETYKLISNGKFHFQLFYFILKLLSQQKLIQNSYNVHKTLYRCISGFKLRRFFQEHLRLRQKFTQRMCQLLKCIVDKGFENYPEKEVFGNERYVVRERTLQVHEE